MEQEQWYEIKGYESCYSICKIGEKGGKIKCDVDNSIVCEFTDFNIPKHIHLYYKTDEKGKIIRDRNGGSSVNALYRRTFQRYSRCFHG